MSKRLFSGMERLLLFIALAVIAALFLSGCGPRVPTPPIPGQDCPNDEDGAGGILRTVGLWSVWLGAIILALLPMAAVLCFMFFSAFLPVVKRYAGPVTLGAFGLIVSGSILKWIGCHLFWIVVCVVILLIVALAAFAWGRRVFIKNKAELLLNKDLDDDGHIGSPKEKTDEQA